MRFGDKKSYITDSRLYSPRSSVPNRAHIDAVLASFGITPVEYDTWFQGVEDHIKRYVNIDSDNGHVFLRSGVNPTTDQLQRPTAVATTFHEAVARLRPKADPDGRGWLGTPPISRSPECRIVHAHVVSGHGGTLPGSHVGRNGAD